MQSPVIVIDSREQLPLSFEGFETVRKALPAGDYSILGHEACFAIERKTRDDFIQSVTRSRDRFFRELGRLAAYDFKCVVIEATMKQIIERCYRSGAHPNALLGTIAAIIFNFGCPVFFCSNRQGAVQFVTSLLVHYYRKVNRECQGNQ